MSEHEAPLVKVKTTKEYEVVPRGEYKPGISLVADYNQAGELIDLTLKRAQLTFGPLSPENMQSIAKNILWVLEQRFSS